MTDDLEKEMDAWIDHHPGFKTDVTNPSYFATLENVVTGDKIETHIHMTMTELCNLIRQSLPRQMVTLTIGCD